MDPVELKYQRMNTTAFIAAKPSEITLIPQEKIKSAGGYKWEDRDPREPQTLRIVELGTHTTPPILTLVNGKQRVAEFWLLGEHDAAIDVGDHWVALDGREWIVGDIVRDNHYEIRALVAERGE